MTSGRADFAVIILGSMLLAGCRFPIAVDHKAGVAPRCLDDVCVEVVFCGSDKNVVGVWIDAPHGTSLVNAAFAVDDEPPCRGHLPVAWVRVDQEVHRSGPVKIGGGHGLVLGFPINTWWGHSGLWRATFVDVDLDVAGRMRCVRTRLTNDKGDEAVGL